MILYDISFPPSNFTLYDSLEVHPHLCKVHNLQYLKSNKDDLYDKRIFQIKKQRFYVNMEGAKYMNKQSMKRGPKMHLKNIDTKSTSLVGKCVT